METQQNKQTVENTSVNQIPQNQNPTMPKNNKNMLLVILLTLLVSALIFGLGGYLLGKQATNNQQVATDKPISYPTTALSQDINPTADINKVSGWLTYPTSTTVGLPYTVKYPSDVEVSEAQDMVYFKKGSSTIFMRFIGKATEINSFMNGYQPFGSTKLNFTDKSGVSFGNLTGIKATAANSYSEETYYYFLKKSSSNGFFIFSYPSGDTQAEKLFNQIVETISIE